MKTILINIIKLYQRTPLSSHSYCKYIPTCSNYTIDAIKEYGCIKGTFLGIKRILRCNPLSKGGYDPLIKKEKKMKKITKILLILLLLISSTGCLKRDNMEGIKIITTVYPLEYVLSELYGNNSIITSIYPDGANIDEYEMTKKELNDYSKRDLFVYNGKGSDKDLALKLLNKNKDILIMDANYGMEYSYGLEELWLNPSNLLMISQNIKNSLIELIDNKYIIEEINTSYNDLKVDLSELDADIKLLIEEANIKTLITTSKSLQFLSKYGLNVILVNDDEKNENNIEKAKNEINKKNIKYAFILEGEAESNAYKNLVKDYKLTSLTFDKIDNISDEERNNKETYITLMKDNLELLTKGLN